jgi:hypothetical protein
MLIRNSRVSGQFQFFDLQRNQHKVVTTESPLLTNVSKIVKKQVQKELEYSFRKYFTIVIYYLLMIQHPRSLHSFSGYSAISLT